MKVKSISNRLFLYLIPSIGSSAIAFLMIPLTTAKLGPKDFGLFALLQCFGALVTSFSMLGSGYIWAKYFPLLKKIERPPFITTILLLGFASAIFFSFLLWLLWPFHELLNLGLKPEDRALYAITLIGAILACPWIHAIEYLTLESKAAHYASIAMISPLLSGVITLYCLYHLGLHVEALFFGSLAKSFCLGFLSCYVLRAYLRPLYSKRWTKTVLLKGLPTAPGNAFQSIAVVLQRNILTANLSIESLGLFTHSQSYSNLISVGVKSLARSLWPISLKEAHARSTSFSMTKAGWEPVFVFLTAGGLLSGAVGKEAIDIFTHGKFTSVAGYVTCWFIYVAIQNAGKEHLAVLYACNKGIFLSYLSVICQCLFIVLMILLIPYIGIWGAILAAIIQQLIYRIFIQINSETIKKVPFNDGNVIFCIVFLIFSLIIQNLFWDYVKYRILFCFLLSTVYAFTIRHLIKKLFSIFFGNLKKAFLLCNRNGIKN